MSPKKEEPLVKGYRVKFNSNFREDLVWWARQDPKTLERIWNLMEDILDGHPFTGIGKPEPLKYETANTWSRRITQEHRLVYRVDKQTIYFLQARFHY